MTARAVESELPSLPGCYLLILQTAAAQTVAVGRLGSHVLPAGWHLYVGSAWGPGGLRGRLRHHLAPAERPHWHIDFVRALAPLVEIWYVTGLRACECEWATALASLPGAVRPIARFGASDCGCAGHLISMAAQPNQAHGAAQAGLPPMAVWSAEARA